jgi:hypothetical protein
MLTLPKLNLNIQPTQGKPTMSNAWQGLRVAAVALAAGMNGGAQAAPKAPTGHLQGFAVNAVSGQAIGGVQVLAGGKVVTTDAHGHFDLIVAPATGQTVHATHPGYAPGLARVEVNASQTTLIVLPLTPQASAITPIDLSTRPDAMPGSYLQAVGTSTQAVESFGAVHLAGAPAVVRIPVHLPSAPPPATATLSRLDESSGLWVEAGRATLRGHGSTLYYEAPASQAGFWAANRPVPTIQVHGSICLPDGADGVSVRTDDMDHAMAAEVKTLPNGSFHVSMRLGGQATLQARSETQSSGPITLGPSNVDIELLSCLPLQDMSGAPPTPPL